MATVSDGVELSEFVSGNLYVRQMRFPTAGLVVNGHAHNFDHTTYILHGALRIEALNDAGDVVRSAIKRATDDRNWVLIKAGVIHRITAEEDNSVGHCLYSHRDQQGEVVQAYNGWDDERYAAYV